MADRLTIYAGPPVAAALSGIGPGTAGQGGDPGSRSGRMNTICERYLLICRAALPDLSRVEWLALCSILNGTVLDETAIRALHLEIEDSEPEQIAQWGVSQSELAIKISALDIAGRIATVEAVERWWRAEGDHDQRLLAAGVTR